MPTRTITVFGATGNQGGSVISAILKHELLSKEWTIRGVTRNPNKPDAQAVIAQGVVMVRADLKNKASIIKAIEGSHAVFGMTNYWEEGKLDIEVMEGQNLADACKEVGVEHLIWSSLPYATKITQCRLRNLRHFDSKAIVAEYIHKLGVPASFVLPAYFMSNIPGAIKQWDTGGDYSLSWLFQPETQIPMLDVSSDFGKFVASCLLNPTATMGKHMLAASGWFTPVEICQAVQNYTKVKCEFREVPIQQYQGSKELFDNLRMIREFEYYGPGAKEGVRTSQEIVKSVGGWEDFSNFEGYLESIGFKRVVSPA